MSKRHSAIEIQISARVKAPKNGRPITEAIVRQAIERKAQTGDDVPGIKLEITRWRHGRNWRSSANTAEEWERFGRFLPASSIVVAIRKT